MLRDDTTDRAEWPHGFHVHRKLITCQEMFRYETLLSAGMWNKVSDRTGMFH